MHQRPHNPARGAFQVALLFRLASLPLIAAADAAPTATPSVTAVHTSSSIRLDGRLDEPAWREAGTIHDLVQQDPHPGEPTPYRTEVQILSDDENLYLGVECFDPAPERLSVHTLQRDASMGGDDHVSFVLDTFADGRTGYFFRVNAAAARLDGLISGPDGYSDDWDGIWDARTRHTPEGWTLEVAIPTRSLRFTRGLDHWGFNVERRVARERTVLRWAGVTLDSSIKDLSRAGMLSGLGGLKQGLGLSISPYGLGRLDSAQAGGTTRSQGTGGLDVAYSFTPELAGVLTANTDFAETEVDTRKINLTRFELFFPEKRSFFLEGASLFEFGSGLGKNFIPFHSRRIGLGTGKELTIPLDAGLKVVGRAGPWGIAALDVQMGETPATRRTNLFAGRVTLDASEHLRVGTTLTFGDPEGIQDTGLLALDAVWHTSTFRGDKNLTTSAWAALSKGGLPADGDFPKGRRTGWGFKVDYPNDLWGMSAQLDEFGDALDARLGFLPRPGTRRYKVGAAYQPRPSGPAFDWARQFFYELSASRVDDLEGSTESWSVFTAPFHVITRSGEQITVNWQPQFDRLDSDFTPASTSAPSATIPPGSYHFTRYAVEFTSADHRPWQAGGSAWFGEFYDGRLTQWFPYVGWNSRSGRLQLKLKGEGDYGHLANGSFAARLYQLQAVYAFTPDVVLSTYTQYDSESKKLGMNNRLRFTIRPGTDLYFVWNRNWKHSPAEGPNAFRLADDQVVLKLRWTFRG